MKMHPALTGLALAILMASAAERGISGLSTTTAREASAATKVAQPIQEAVMAIRARIRSGAAPADLRALSTELIHVNDAGEIQVYIILTEFRPDHVAQLEAVGLRVELMLPDFRLIQGWVPANAVDLIAGYDFVAEVKPPGYPVRRGG